MGPRQCAIDSSSRRTVTSSSPRRWRRRSRSRPAALEPQPRTPAAAAITSSFPRSRVAVSGGAVEVEIGIGKSGRRAYGFDDIAIVPSRRTRDPEDVDITWELDAFKFELPVMGSAMDGALSPRTAIEIGQLGGVGCLNLEGLWTRYDDPDVLFEEIAELPNEKATRRM